MVWLWMSLTPCVLSFVSVCVSLRRAHPYEPPPAGYKIVKIRDPVTQQLGLLFTVSLPEIKQGERPRRRFMSAFEQKREIPNRALQYLVVSW